MPEYRGMNLILSPTDTEFRPYLEEVSRRRRLVLRRCAACGLVRYPPGAACPWCTSLEWQWQEVSGQGTIYSYEMVTQAVQPGFRDWVPYPVVLVELDEQRGVPTPDEAIRMVANLVDANFNPEREEKVAIGLRVEAAFQEIGEGLLLPQFHLSSEPPLGRVWRLPD
ncbi:MAG: Zn-ribbon domain-containing OB-fold protein [Dehalococcoidia bacterium]